MRFTFLFLSIATVAAAQIAPPQLGFVVDHRQSLRPLVGLSGNLLLGPSAGEGVISAASSQTFVMIKTNPSLSILDTAGNLKYAITTSPGPALFAFCKNGDPALVWLPNENVLLQWNVDHLEPLNLTSEVLALAPGRLVIQRGDTLYELDIATSNQTALPGVNAPVWLDPEGSLIYAEGTALVRPEGRLELGFKPRYFVPLGPGWLLVGEVGTTRQFAVRITPGYEQVSLLPAGQPRVPEARR